MTAITFDTFKFVDRLEKAGLPREQASAIVEAQQQSFNNAQDATLATKADVRELKTDCPLGEQHGEDGDAPHHQTRRIHNSSRRRPDRHVEDAAYIVIDSRSRPTKNPLRRVFYCLNEVKRMKNEIEIIFHPIQSEFFQN